MTAYREPGRDVDRTDIERAKIHEAGETKRKAIEEQEKTKRAKVEKYGSAPFGAAAVVLCSLLLAGSFVAYLHYDSKNPHPPAPLLAECVEKVEVISRLSSHRDCEKGGHIETTPLPDGDVLWKCVCGTRVSNSDLGTP